MNFRTRWKTKKKKKKKKDEGFDLILLHAKCLVYKCRLNKPQPILEAFVNNFKHIYDEVDKHVQLMEMSYDKFIYIKKWPLYNQLVA